MEWLSVKQFSVEVGLTVQRIHQLIKSEDSRLRTQRFGFAWMVDPGCLKNFNGKAHLSPQPNGQKNNSGSKKKLRAKRAKNR